MGIVVGAYPLLSGFDESGESDLYRMLGNYDISGLELPWTGEIAGHDARWLTRHLPAHWTSTVTSIPATMKAMAADARFGLASRDQDGRRAALGQVRAMRDAADSANQAAGRALIGLVELHSAPSGGAAAASANAFQTSIAEIVSWNWEGIALSVEHVDAHSAVAPPAKGFLSLEAEIAIARDTAGLGIVLNWARSAIELRSAARVVEHIALTRSAGVLSGIVFSGVSDDWVDGHLPFYAASGPDGDPHSLLTAELARASLDAAGSGGFVGLKIRPTTRATTIAERARLVEQSIQMLAPQSVRTR
jgi:hypothetical protein